MLSMADIKENSQCVEKIVPDILKEVQKRDGVFSAKILHSGKVVHVYYFTKLSLRFKI